ncbi:HAMP domain-containing histidine kinase [Candidatus Daviesbacteria bacterium]|nr:HAMP domain-containing histidine kinase [Candidatus Daviesbacteria bacterium]
MEEIWDKTKRILVQLAHFQKRNRIKRYGLPLILAVGIFSLIIFLPANFIEVMHNETISLFLLILIVTISSWYGGLGPGVLATILTVPTSYLMHLEMGLPLEGDLLVSIVYIFVGFSISIISEARYEMENQKDEFISFVSHELKNPLAIIKGFAELISHNVKTQKKEQIRSYGVQISAQSNRILELINDLLDITKIEIGKFTYNGEIFNIDDLVKEVIEHQRLISPGRTIQLLGHTKKVILADKFRIRQVLVNLLTNAIKYSPDDKKIIVRLKEQKGWVQISVKDFGIGIEKNEQARIFDRYYRTKNVQKKRSEGLGLGLYITNQIIKHHHGKIWVKSKLGKGSTFFVSLPIYKPMG